MRTQRISVIIACACVLHGSLSGCGVLNPTENVNRTELYFLVSTYAPEETPVPIQVTLSHESRKSAKVLTYSMWDGHPYLGSFIEAVGDSYSVTVEVLQDVIDPSNPELIGPYSVDFILYHRTAVNFVWPGGFGTTIATDGGATLQGYTLGTSGIVGPGYQPMDKSTGPGRIALSITGHVSIVDPTYGMIWHVSNAALSLQTVRDGHEPIIHATTNSLSYGSYLFELKINQEHCGGLVLVCTCDQGTLTKPVSATDEWQIINFDYPKTP